MATTAHAMSNLDVPAVDDMDMHSDSGLDFGDGDGDIELDLDPTPMPHGEDDDVSIIDAASDAGHVQPGSEEADDFMVDPEDVIEEDDMYAEGEDPVMVEETFAESTAVLQSPATAPLDEDLIDYSDDEGEQPTNAPSETHEEDMTEVHEEQVEQVLHEQDETCVPESETHIAENETHVPENATGDQVEHIENPSRDETTQHNTSTDAYNTQHDTGADEANIQHQTPDKPDAESVVHEDDHSIDGEEGGVPLQEHESPVKHAEDSDHDHDSEEPEEQFQDDQAADQQLHEDEHEDDLRSEQRTITLNYNGNEWWLFKQHDADGSGDWLLEDLSLTKSRISDVFQACRSSLGDSISNEHELGFRFDHLHNLELYEDNTACVAVSLEKLVDLYHTLQAQDGVSDPESFYISLLSRPRFVTLLSDIAKFVEDGSGYSALNAAVAAGETRFTNVFSESPSDEVTEWDNEEQNEAATERREESVYIEVQEEDDQSEHASSQHDTNEEHQGAHQHEHVENSSHEETVHEDEAHVEQEHADGSHVPTDQQELSYSLEDDVAQAVVETLSEADARRAQEEDDLVGYSDDEDEAPVQEAETVSVKASSPSSSTVQGDDAADAEDDAHAADSSNADTKQIDEHEPVEVSHDNESHHPVESNEAETQAFQHLVEQSFDANNEFGTFQEGEDQTFNLDSQYGDNTNEDFAGYEYQTIDEQLQLDFANGNALYNEDGDSTRNGYTESDALLDLDNTSAWATNQSVENLPEDTTLVHDDVSYPEDEETGVADQPAAAVTSDATAAAASSDEPKNLSPQGRKRSIDEAGHGVDDALDSIDTKRPKI
ncbi:hypothetical protein NX059_010392 [Plenodomus lindquistii]|nr:hypothetical protein NX059_010392 [Plenodomus lindquistii]